MFYTRRLYKYMTRRRAINYNLLVETMYYLILVPIESTTGSDGPGLMYMEGYIYSFSKHVLHHTHQNLKVCSRDR